MPYDIQMPDGTVIRGIPDSVNPSDAKARISASMQKQPASPLTEMGRGAMRGIGGALDFPGMAAGLIARGAQRAIGGVTGGQGPDIPGAIAPFTGGGTRAQEAIAQLSGGASQAAPESQIGGYAQTLGEFLPYAVPGSVAGLPRRAVEAGAAAIGSETGGKVFQGSDLEQAARLGGALAGPAALGQTARVMTPGAGISPERMAAVQRLRAEGIQPTAGQVRNNKAVKLAEEATQRGQNLYEAQTDQFTRSALRAIGEDAIRATPDVLEAATQRIGQQIEDATRNISFRPSASGASNFQKIVQDFEDVSTGTTPRIFNRLAEASKEAVMKRQPIPAEQLTQWRSKLSALTTSSDQAVRQSAIRMIEAVDDSIEQSLASIGRTDDVAKWKQARAQYRNLLAIEDAVSRAGADAAEGIIKPSALRSALVRQGRRSYVQGKRELGPIADAAVQVLTPLTSSGTAERNVSRRGVLEAVSAIPTGIYNRLVASPLGQRYLMNETPALSRQQAARAGIPGLLSMPNEGQQ